MRGVHPLDPVDICNIHVAADKLGVGKRSDDELGFYISVEPELQFLDLHIWYNST